MSRRQAQAGGGVLKNVPFVLREMKEEENEEDGEGDCGEALE